MKMSTFLIILIAVGGLLLYIFSGKKKPAVQYTVVENKVSQSAFKKQASVRLQLAAPATDQEIKELIWYTADGIDQPYVYIYVYGQHQVIKNGGEWVASFTRENGIDQPVKFK